MQTRMSLRCSYILHFRSHKWHPITICARKWNFSALANLHRPSSQHQNLVYWRFVAFKRAIVTNLMCWLKWRFGCHLIAWEQERLWAFFTVPKSHVLAHIAICVPFMRAAKALASLQRAQLSVCYICWKLVMPLVTTGVGPSLAPGV